MDTTSRLSLATQLTQPPQFTHDCEQCTYLGRHVDDKGNEADLYIHLTQRDVEQTVIARYSSEGREYSSGAPFSFGSNPALTEARLRAQARGLVEFDVVSAVNYAKPGTVAYDEMLRALPGTLEIKAYLAYQERDFNEAQVLVRRMVSLAKRRYPHSCTTHEKCIDLVESQLRQFIGALYGKLDMQVYKTAMDMVDFLYAEAPQATADLEPL